MTDTDISTTTDTDLNTDDGDLDLDALNDEYDEMLALLDIGAEQCVYKIAGNGRITDPAKEQARSKWVNSLTKIVRERRQVVESRELVNLASEIEEIKESKETGEIKW